MTTQQQQQQQQHRRRVITEEEYTSTLSKIIQRDYFSDLPELQKKAAVLNGSFIAAADGSDELQRGEDGLPINEIACGSTTQPSKRQTVTEFHNRVTSEDNAEFERNQKEEIKAYREKLEELFRPNQFLLLEGSSNDGVDDNQKLLPPPPGSLALSDETKQHPLSNNGLFGLPAPTFSSGNATMRSGNSLPICSDEQESRQLMPPPPKKQKVHSAVVDVSNKEKRIVPSQTRFAPVTTSIQRQSTNPFRSSVLSRRRQSLESDSAYSTDASTDIDSESVSIAAGRKQHLMRKRREAHTLVNTTPLLTPGTITQSDDVGKSDRGKHFRIITFGTVAGEPVEVQSLERSNAMSTEPASGFVFAKYDGARADEAQRLMEHRIARGKVGSADSVTSSSSSTRVSRSSSRKSKGSSHRKRMATSHLSSRGKRDLSSFSPAAVSLLSRTSKGRIKTRTTW
ncbi:expressed unknown protein [Seminavis robusta]|uniref:Uncharacterized protein n=1 Tax=Seminavis robusta TaxID=568900 RepID=A0A9N8DNK8_9STRA|nr:expressed unknown protein [Seminavis robusta]|eukprot:Sro182_g079360.1 n/a (454) ;mRNA; f:48222-49583